MGEHAHIGIALAIGLPLLLLLLLSSSSSSYWITQPFKPHLKEFPPRPKSSRRACCHSHRQ